MRAGKFFGMAVGLVSLLLALSGTAKEWQLRLAKGRTVVAKIPTGLWQTPKRSVSLGQQRIYVVDVDNVVATSDWQASGFPYCGELTLAKVSKKSAYTEVELQNSSIYLKLHFSKVDDLESEFQKVVVPGDWSKFEASEDFRANVFPVQAAKIFTGPLAQLTDPLKLSLLRMVCNGQGTLGTETYKGKSYLAVSLADDGNIYNSLKLNQSAGVALVINDRLLQQVKLFGKVAGLAGVDGVKLSLSISYENLATESDFHTDKLELYVPLDLTTKFANADITSQQLVDGSVVLLNDNRIHVPLAGGT